MVEAVIGGALIKKVFAKVLQNLQENSYAGVSFFNKVSSLKPATLLKKRLPQRCFSAHFNNTFFTEHLRRTAFDSSCLPKVLS